ncbi:class I SAM-dependent methyltransferase [Amycolatopsis sp. CA-230715]|uniref:class I SAM-dependent methyltransferase n=1 Tax=Amycolatopsis sp. CA-230715 TaxID=2745196 RepID=UPI001C01DB19|nr:class I SAM-dependent methyltransferase [Amycolatopsis sp. CA-230715]
MDLTTVAVPHTLDRLRPLLPEPPARLLEVGCGRGALAVALMELGYRVTGVDRNAEMAAAAGDRGVPVVQADIRDITPGEGYDVVLFTRSLHHADDLDEILGHAASLLTPGGLLVIEEFAWERVNQAAAHFLSDNRAMLVAVGLLDAGVPSGDPLDTWVADHADLHRGSAMIAALDRTGADFAVVHTSILWRLIAGRGGSWVESSSHTIDALTALRGAEERRVAEGALPAVGFLASVRIFGAR